MRNKLIALAVFFWAGQLLTYADPTVTPNVQLEKLNLPKGFKIEVYAVVPGARSLALSPEGVLFVGTGGLGGKERKVYAVFDHHHQGKADEVRTLIDHLDVPNGVAYKDGDLYVAEITRILKFPKILSQNLDSPRFEVLPQRFPLDHYHGWKFIRFGPDGLLYVPVGAPCNACDPGKESARIYKIDVHSNQKTLVAQGVRNSVGFDFDPNTKELWFTDNGRDFLGDDLPPCELNKLTKEGEHFGFPYCHGKDVKDPDNPLPPGRACQDYTPPQVDFPAHVSPLGMRFYRGSQFPGKYKHRIILAQHGSTLRKIPQGYRLVSVEIRNGQAVSDDVFVDGWLQGNTFWGRPVDVEEMPDGSLLVSDDWAGLVYKVTYTAPQ